MATGGITLWGASQMLGDFFGRSTDWPAIMYFSLQRDVPPGPFTEGGELDEPPAELGYFRVPVPNVLGSWLVEGEVMTNAADIIFPAALDTWGLVRYYAICNAPTGGMPYFYGDLAGATPSEATDVFVIPAGVLSVNLGPIFTGLGDGN